ncbi:MAG: 4Fe-4S binding protein [Christensenellales bacterium]|jgi:MinD superfamily P-loop ATPase
MKIAVLSGKGGTGKTLVSVNLASVARSATYIDCDVEEPNGHLFFKPNILSEENVFVKIPKLDPSLCTGCRKCIDFCKFNALAYVNNKPLVFDEVCHSCGGCVLVCPEQAFSETDKLIGKVKIGKSKKVDVYTGILNIGEATGIPIINNLLANKETTIEKPVVIDCPPGSACIVMESIKDADYCVLVAEPTLFGVHNLNMVYELVTLFKKPFGVVLNKCLDDENPSKLFCLEKNIKILAEIPFDPELGKLNSEAKIVAEKSNKYHDLFSSLLNTITKEVLYETTTNS